MSNASQQMERLSDREFVIKRTFAAARPLVWQAWSECEHLQHWWAPTDWSMPICKMDFRVGGTWHYCMKGLMPDGTEMESWGLTVYQEIVAPERFVALDQFADAAGNVSAEMPKMLNTVTFTALDDQTQVTSLTEFASGADLETVIKMGMEEGVTQSWDKLAAHLAQSQQ
ncbi:MAG: SRPBCC domain-containing protein [Caldilineaceae bacterium]|nr:SRPBCC domain-containing protein [Caldilineaceae bacterium]